MNTPTKNNMEHFMMKQVNTMQQSKLSAVKKKQRFRGTWALTKTVEQLCIC